MKKFSILILAFSLALVSVSFADPYFFRGYVHVNGPLAPNGTIVEIYVGSSSSPSNAVKLGEGWLGGFPEGRYEISVVANSGDTVSFRVNNLSLIVANGTNVTAQTLGSNIIHDSFNLSVNKSSNGVACLYAIGCSSGFCTDSYCCNSACGGASEDCNVAGSLGTCTSTATTSTSTGSSGGGGGSTSTTTTETLTVANINAGSTATVTTTNSASLGVETIQFTSSVSATNVQVTVKETTATAASVSVAISSSDGAVYKYLEITKTGIQTSQMSSVKINFKVPKSWLASNNIDKNTVSLNRYSDGWTKLATTIRSEDANYVYYTADTPGFSTFAITGQKSTSFFDLISKIDDYYKGRITFFDLISAIDLYYKSQ